MERFLGILRDVQWKQKRNFYHDGTILWKLKADAFFHYSDEKMELTVSAYANDEDDPL